MIKIQIKKDLIYFYVKHAETGWFLTHKYYLWLIKKPDVNKYNFKKFCNENLLSQLIFFSMNS